MFLTRFNSFYKTCRPLVLSLPILILVFGICTSVLLYNSLRYDFPLGYAGLYTQMAEQIADGNFALPSEILFYGPGGIPSAYPPLALYLMAVFLKLGFPALGYLRFMPVIFSIVSLVCFFLLAENISGSIVSAGLATILLATSPELYRMHTLAVGVVRAPAFALALIALYYFVRSLKEIRSELAIFAGIFFGLTIMTHLFYAVFFLVCATAWAFTLPQYRSMSRLGITILAGSLVAFPWVVIILFRYGFAVFMGAFASHDNATFFNLFQDPVNFFFARIGSGFSVTLDFAGPLVLLGISLGFVLLVLNRQFGLPLAFMMVLLILPHEGVRFIIALGAILAGVSATNSLPRLSFPEWIRKLILLIFTLAIIMASVNGIREISQMSPKLNSSIFSLVKFVQKNTPSQSKYLILASHDEAEWFPFLLQREPLISQWGSEWLGTYAEQTDYLAQVLHCQSEQNMDCLDDIFTLLGSPDMLITRKGDKKLTAQLEASTTWRFENEIGAYLVWSNYVHSQYVP